MDKRTVRLSIDKAGRLVCASITKGRCKQDAPQNGKALCPKCTEYALVTPADLASLETRLAEAEGEVETLKAVCGKKDEALQQFLIGAKHESCAYAPEDPDPTWHCCNWSEVVEQVQAALSLSPASVAEEATYARVGRAVEKWCNAEEPKGEGLSFATGYCRAQVDVLKVIAKARQQDKTE